MMIDNVSDTVAIKRSLTPYVTLPINHGQPPCCGIWREVRRKLASLFTMLEEIWPVGEYMQRAATMETINMEL